MFYANKKKRQELSELSQKVFGTKSKWHYFVKERGLTIDSVETQMLALSKQMDKQLEENNENTRPQNRPQPKVARGNRKERRKAQALWNKIRRRQAKLVATTKRSSAGDNKGS